MYDSIKWPYKRFILILDEEYFTGKYNAYNVDKEISDTISVMKDYRNSLFSKPFQEV